MRALGGWGWLPSVAVLAGVRRSGYDAAPPASRVAVAIAARRPAAALDPGASTAPGQGQQGQAMGLPGPGTAHPSQRCQAVAGASVGCHRGLPGPGWSWAGTNIITRRPQ